MRVAYFTNQYPKVSHTFIRREIHALEALGLNVQRFALRGWDSEVTDSADQQERQETRYILQDGITPLLMSGLRQLLRQPGNFLRAAAICWRLSRHADRSPAHHAIYLLEACLLLKALRAQGIQHVHGHFGTNPAAVLLLTRLLGGPSYSFTVHGPEEFDKPQFLGLALKVEHAAFVVAISSYGRSQLWRWLPAQDWHKVQVVHCGLEPGFAAAAPAATAFSANRFVCVGRLCEQKGQLLLIQALVGLKDRGLKPELVLAGDGEMRADIEHAIEAHGLQDQVRITGWIDSATVRQQLLAARALVLPSFAEGLPVVLMEAMALGRPVISTCIAGIPELVRHEHDGWLVPAGDVGALVEAMAECLRAPADQLQRMGEAGRARAQARHDVHHEAARLVEHFKAAMAGST